MTGESFHEFKPDWCLAPDSFLREWMTERGLSARDLATRCCAPLDQLAVVEGLVTDVLSRKPLNEQHAEVLERGTGISAGFWLRFEQQYRDGLAAGLTDISSATEYG